MFENAVVGILLAAGSGSRFDPTGHDNKLLRAMADGRSLAEHAAASLVASVGSVLAVVRPGLPALESRLLAAGCEVSICPDAVQGMGWSLAHAIRCTRNAAGWIVALADMPFIQTATIEKIAAALQDGGDIAAPFYAGRRGHPVGFGHRHLNKLLNLSGDAGARELLARHAIIEIPVNDAGVVTDIDSRNDLARQAGGLTFSRRDDDGE